MAECNPIFLLVHHIFLICSFRMDFEVRACWRAYRSVCLSFCPRAHLSNCKRWKAITLRYHLIRQKGRKKNLYYAMNLIFRFVGKKNVFFPFDLRCDLNSTDLSWPMLLVNQPKILFAYHWYFLFILQIEM